MDLIKNLLDRYTKLATLNTKDKEEIILVIKKILNITLKVEQIKIKGNKINIQTSSIIKSEIFINKNLILEQINSSESILVEIIDIN